jgi:hypothetical protein
MSKTTQLLENRRSHRRAPRGVRRKGMTFWAGPYLYSVRRKWDLTMDGARVHGLCSSFGNIWLDGDIDDDELITTLRHEHAHMWEFVLGLAAPDQESQANRAAFLGAHFDREFTEQGGLETLRNIPIEGSRELLGILSSTCAGGTGFFVRTVDWFRSDIGVGLVESD